MSLLAETTRIENSKRENPVIRVLHVEDNADDHQLVKHCFKSIEQATYEIEWVSSYREGLEAIQKKEHDAYLIDHFLGAKTGIALVRETAIGMDPDAVCILITGVDDYAVDQEAMALGVSDYLSKECIEPRILERSMRYALERKRVLRDLFESERQKELLVATIAHDLKTPIQAELKVLEQLLAGKYGLLLEKQASVLSEVAKSNRYLYHMVNNLLTSYRFAENEVTLAKELADLNVLVKTLASGYLEVLAEEKMQNIILDLDPALRVVEMDAVEMGRVLYNLVQNAINYSEVKQEIIVTTRQDDWRVVVSVSDHGDGLSKGQIEKLFKPFSVIKTYKSVGTGLGLYLSRKIIEAHGGTLTVESEPGKGSCFTFWLPAC